MSEQRPLQRLTAGEFVVSKERLAKVDWLRFFSKHRPQPIDPVVEAMSGD